MIKHEKAMIFFKLGLLFSLLFLFDIQNPVFAQKQIEINGKIISFECGDNCWLTIETEDKNQLTGLCVASACKPWNFKTEIPKELIGSKVTVRLSKGQALDASFRVRGSATAFDNIRFSSADLNSTQTSKLKIPRYDPVSVCKSIYQNTMNNMISECINNDQYQ